MSMNNWKFVAISFEKIYVTSNCSFLNSIIFRQQQVCSRPPQSDVAINLTTIAVHPRQTGKFSQQLHKEWLNTQKYYPTWVGTQGMFEQ